MQDPFGVAEFVDGDLLVGERVLDAGRGLGEFATVIMTGGVGALSRSQRLRVSCQSLPSRYRRR